MSKSAAKKAEELVKTTIEGLGFELADVEFVKEQGEWVLTFFIDKPDGVTIDDCETVSRAIDPVLDESDFIQQKYFLSVSSIGLDRPLKKQKDFERNIGKEVEVRLYAPLNGVKEFHGILNSFDEEGFELDVQGTPLRLESRMVALVRPYFVF